MNILYYDWNSLAQLDMVQAFVSSGANVHMTTYKCMNYEQDLEFELKLLNDLEKQEYDFVFSFNYFPVISTVCEKRNVKYVSWIFDSPHLNVYSNTARHSCNIIFHFDRYACEVLKNKGLDTIYHLPMAANVERLDKIWCTSIEQEQYCSEVSFVGRLYDTKNFYDQIQYLPDYLKGYFEGIMQSQMLIHGYHFLPEVLPDTIMDELRKYIKLDLGSTFSFDERMVFSNLFLSQKITSMERMQVLDLLSKYMQVDLYSDYSGDALSQVNHKGIIDSDYVAPKVFKNSKINLNISLRSIVTGIPLRVFEVLGNKGFLISNYQAELVDYFVPGEELMIYESIDDLLSKTQYYLRHETERKRIAANAYEKIKEQHTFHHRVRRVYETVNI